MPAFRVPATFLLAGVAALALALVVAACSPPGGGSASGGVAAATASPSGPRGGATSDACALLSVEEVQSALGVSGLKAIPNPGDDVSYCNYETADGKPVAATSYTRANGGVLFDSYKSEPGAVPIPGIADGAVMSGSILYVKKGESVFGFQLASTAGMSATKLAEIATKVATAAARRLP